MKKLYFAAFTVAALAISNQVNAQEGFSLSVKTTPQISFLQNKDDNNSGLKKNATFDAAFGLGAAYNFTPNMGFGIDVLYSIQGQKYETVGSSENFKKVSYIKIPTYFSYTYNLSDRFALTGKVGPQLSILTDSKITDGNGSDIKVNTKKEYENITFGGMIALGAQYKLNKAMFLTAQPRFDYDFTNAENKDFVGHASGRSDTHNMSAGLELGFKYMLN